jgi:hypothetical protein
VFTAILHIPFKASTVKGLDRDAERGIAYTNSEEKRTKI